MPRERHVRRSLCLALALLACLAPVHTAGADEKKAPEPRCVQLARAVLTAFRSGDQTALAGYARVDIPDPWVGCFILCGWGESKAARAWIAAGPRLETRQLGARIDAWAKAPPSADTVAEVVAADEHHEQQRWKDAAAAYGALTKHADPFVRALAHVRQGLACQRLGAADHCVGLLYPGLTAARKLGWQEGIAQARWALGHAHFELDRYHEALASWHRLTELLDRLQRPAALARERVDLAGAYGELGDYRRALELLARAKPVLYQHGDARSLTTAILSSGVAQLRLGNLAAALRNFEAALQLARRLKVRSTQAVALSYAGNVHAMLAEEEPALAKSAAAVALCDATADPRGLAEALSTQAYVHEHLGVLLREPALLEKAAALYPLARSAYLKAGHDAGATEVDLHLAVVQRVRGELAAALRLLDRVEPDLAEARELENLASLHVERGLIHLRSKEPDLEAAMRSFRAGYKIALRIDHGYVQVRAAEGAAEVHFRQAMGAAARSGTTPDKQLLRMAFQETTKAVAMLTRLVSGLGDEQGARAREPRAKLFRLGARIAVERGDVQGFHAMLEHGRSLGFLETLEGKEGLRALASREGNRRVEQEARAKEWIARKQLREARRKRLHSAVRLAKEALDEATQQTNAILESLQRTAKARSALVYPKPVELAALRAALAANEAYVAYALLDDGAYALVVEPGAEPRIAALGPAAKVRDLAASALRGMEQEDAGAEAVAKALHTLVLDPLQLRKTATRLLVSPDGALFQVPLTAALAGREIVYVASGSLHTLLRRTPASGGTGILGLGNPHYDPSRGLIRLPSTKKEVEALPGAVVRLMGKDATFARLHGALQQKEGRWLALHFGCHGKANADRPMASSLEIAADEQHGGTLYARDVMLLDIPADLAVLSACESGKGRIYEGEGLLGLTRAFMFSGAPRVVCSLWRVDDDATGALMKKFYEVWSPASGKGRVGAAAALKRAQEHVRKQQKWRHPYYWAAWVLWGLPD